MTLPDLESMLSALRKYDVAEFRHKEGEEFVEIILSGGGVTEEDEKEEMEDVSVYHSSNIGITKRGFDDDRDEEIRQAHKRVIKDH